MSVFFFKENICRTYPIACLHFHLWLRPLCPDQEVGCGASLGVISESLLVTGGQGCVSFWDLNFGDLLQTVYLGQSSDGQGVRQLLVLDNAAIICDFGSELSLVYVPSVLEKLDWGTSMVVGAPIGEMNTYML